MKSLWQLSRSKAILTSLTFPGLLAIKEMASKPEKVKLVTIALERLSCHKDFKITQAQTKVGFFYLSPLLQVEFRAIFERFSYIFLNGSKRNAILSRM